jgi:hypothetical protein
MTITQRSTWSSRVVQDTRFLQTDDSPLYRRIRELLRLKGIDVDRSLAAVLGPEDQACESGIVVTPEKQVYEFELSYRNVPVEAAEFSTWRDLTDTYHTRARRDRIAAALEMVQDLASAAGQERS